MASWGTAGAQARVHLVEAVVARAHVQGAHKYPEQSPAAVLKPFHQPRVFPVDADQLGTGEQVAHIGDSLSLLGRFLLVPFPVDPGHRGAGLDMGRLERDGAQDSPRHGASGSGERGHGQGRGKRCIL